MQSRSNGCCWWHLPKAVPGLLGATCSIKKLSDTGSLCSLNQNQDSQYTALKMIPIKLLICKPRVRGCYVSHSDAGEQLRNLSPGLESAGLLQKGLSRVSGLYP